MASSTAPGYGGELNGGELNGLSGDTATAALDYGELKARAA